MITEELRAKAKQHLALANEGIIPVTNYYAAFQLIAKADKIEDEGFKRAMRGDYA